MKQQKSGIMLNDLDNFYNYCTKELSLNIIGLMCLPPINSNTEKYFKLLKKTAEKLKFKRFKHGYECRL